LFDENTRCSVSGVCNGLGRAVGDPAPPETATPAGSRAKSNSVRACDGLGRTCWARSLRRVRSTNVSAMRMSRYSCPTPPHCQRVGRRWRRGITDRCASRGHLEPFGEPFAGRAARLMALHSHELISAPKKSELKDVPVPSQKVCSGGRDTSPRTAVR